MTHYDAIVIGSGQGGTPLSKKLAQQGLKTALIEKRFIGGTCINDGCTPTKTMVASARMAHTARNSNALGVHTGEVTVDLPAIVQRKNEIVNMFRDGSEKGLEKTDGLELIMGEAVFTGPKQLIVSLNKGGTLELSADKVFINTGTTAQIPPINGLDDIRFVTNTTILQLTQIPEHLLVLGGGYIGLEFGQMFSRFGSKVTIVETSDHLLPHEDRDIADCICGILMDEGITVNTDSSADNFKMEGKNIKATLIVKGQQQQITCSHVLVAAGRVPQTARLQLQKTGVDTNEKGFINVNNKLETSAEGIYAFGDVKDGPAFTHIAYNDHLIIYKNLFEHASLIIEGRPVPYCMFTDPQLGRIGLSEDEAIKKGFNIKTAVLSMDKVARAIETGETRGIMKAVVNADDNQILGAAIIGEEGGETMTVLQVAMMGKLPYTDIKEAIFAHPLYAESLNNLFMAINK